MDKPMAAMKHLVGNWWWASPRRMFLYPGLYRWNGKRNVRVIPLPRVLRQRPPRVHKPIEPSKPWPRH